MSFAVLRFEKIKSPEILRARSRHNLRLGKLPKHVDGTRTERNQTAGNAVEGFKEMAKGVKLRKNGVLAVEAVVSFSKDAEKSIDIEKWRAKNLEWFRERFGEENILENSLHLDEETPHMHIVFAPRVGKKWNCREYLGGRAKIVQLQDSYAEAMKEFGLERGIKKRKLRHVPVEIYREWERLKQTAIEAEKVGNVAGRKVMLEANQYTLESVSDFLGAKKYEEFLDWFAERTEREQRIKEKEAKLKNSGKKSSDPTDPDDPTDP